MSEQGDMENRQKIIIQTGRIGILANVLLAGAKAVIGTVSSSIAIVMDAVNNLSDALSSVITIIGAKLGGKAPDKKHPLGHGRAEYMSATIISVLILYAGVMSLTESVKKILQPEKPDYAPISLVVIALAVLVKIFLGRYVKKKGEEAQSDALVASGEDARLDAVISASTLAAAAVYLITGVSLEAYLAAAISILIIKSGFEMLRNTVSELLGERVDGELTGRVRTAAISVSPVLGVYDLVLHNYGPGRLVGSLHIEVPDHLTAVEIDALSRQIEQKVYQETGVILTGITVYASNDADTETARVKRAVYQIALRQPHVKEAHGFYKSGNAMRFDIVVDFEAKDRRQVLQTVLEEVKKSFPDDEVHITLDRDVSD